MKRFNLPVIIAIIMVFAFIQRSNAQKQTCGLYLTLNDYRHHKLSYAVDQNNPRGDKICTHEFLGRNKVTVINNGKKMVLAKNRIYGYHGSDNKDYRFYNKDAYRIIDTARFWMYGYDEPTQSGRSVRVSIAYYFSTRPNDQVLPCTIENIEKAFPNGQKFSIMVEAAFKSDRDMGTYDKITKEYKIKELYAESLKK